MDLDNCRKMKVPELKGVYPLNRCRTWGIPPPVKRVLHRESVGPLGPLGPIERKHDTSAVKTKP